MSALATSALLLQLAAAAGTEADCGTAVRGLGGRSVDLAPPPGWVEICAEDAALCRTLTAAYPASVTTLGYFVPAAEWRARPTGRPPAFSRSLVAQVAPNKPADKLPDVKSFIRSQQHGTDRARLAETLAAEGQARLGVFEDTADSISMGAVARRTPTPGAGAGAAGGGLLAMTNSAVAVGPDLLSLYVYAQVADLAQVAGVEALTRRWLACVRRANRPAPRAPAS